MSDAPALTDALERALEGSPAGRLRPPRELLQPVTLDELLGLALAQWAAIAACWLGMAVSPGWTYPLWALLVATRIHALGVLLHEACHMPLRGRTWRSTLLEVLAGYPLASTLAAMRYHHLRHHRDSCMPTDPYAKPDLRGRPVLLALYWLRTALILPAWFVRGWLGLAAWAVPALRTPYARGLLQDRSGRADLRDDPQVIACARAELGQVLAHAAVVGVAVVWPAEVLWYLVVPGLVASLLCGWRLLMEHSYQRVDDRSLGSILASTRDHNLDVLGSALFAPLNIGHHVVHHLHPQVGWRALPALRDWYREQVPDRYPPLRPFWPGAGAMMPTGPETGPEETR